MTAPARSEYLELADYVGPLRRRWATIVLFVILGVGLAAAYYVVTPRVYTSTVQVQVAALPGAANVVGGRTSGQVNMDNEAQIAQSQAVTALVIKDRALSLTRTSPPRLHVSVPPNTTVLQISCDMPKANLAQRCAQDTGLAFLSQQTSALLTQASNDLQKYQADAIRQQQDMQRYNALAKAIKTATAARASDNARATTDFTKLRADETHISTLQPLIQSLQPTRTVSHGQVTIQPSAVVGTILTPANLPGGPSSPRKLLAGGSGLAAGLVIGLAVAYARDRRRPRLHSARDAGRLLGLPVLLSLNKRTAAPATSLASPRSPAGQAYSELAQYAARSLGDGSHVILVAGTSAGAGGSSVAANLAAALARIRAETVLICADVRLTSVPQLLSLSDGPGVAELLDGTASVTEVIWSAPDAYRLGVITPGQDVDSIPYTAEYDSVRQLLVALRQDARYIVIETRSTQDGDGTFGLAEFADAAIVVAELEASRIADIEDCLQRLGRLQTTVLGAAVLPLVRRLATPARPGGDEARRKDQARAPAAASLHKPVQGKAGLRTSAGGNGQHGDGDGDGGQHGSRPVPPPSTAESGRPVYSSPAGAAPTRPLPGLGPQPRPTADARTAPSGKGGGKQDAAADRPAVSERPARSARSSWTAGSDRADGDRLTPADNRPASSVPAGDDRRSLPVGDDRPAQRASDDRRSLPASDDRRSQPAQDDPRPQPASDDRRSQPAQDDPRPQPASDDRRSLPASDDPRPRPAGEDSHKDAAARPAGADVRASSPDPGRPFGDPLYFDSVPAHRPRSEGWGLPRAADKAASGAKEEGSHTDSADTVTGS